MIICPAISNSLWIEYEDVFSRDIVFSKSELNLVDRETVFKAFLEVCEWYVIHFIWRPNLKVEADNHIVELAIASGANFVITNDILDFESSNLTFKQFQIITPKAFIEMKNDL